jgi:hypothetical protein
MASPKIDPALKRYAYFILDVLLTQREGTEGTTYEPDRELVPGVLKVETKNHGTGTHTFVQEDGPFIFTLTGVYICTGRWNETTDSLDFDYGALRLLNLVMLGANGEQILSSRLHEVVDHCKAIVEENLENVEATGSLEHILRDLDRFEKSNYRKH